MLQIAISELEIRLFTAKLHNHETFTKWLIQYSPWIWGYKLSLHFVNAVTSKDPLGSADMVCKRQILALTIEQPVLAALERSQVFWPDVFGANHSKERNRPNIESRCGFRITQPLHLCSQLLEPSWSHNSGPISITEFHSWFIKKNQQDPTATISSSLGRPRKIYFLSCFKGQSLAKNINIPEV